MTGRPDTAGDLRPALTVADFAERARSRMEPAVWDFVEGGAGEERTLAANLRAFDRVRLRPRVLTGAGVPSLATTVLGRRWAAPLAVAPMAYHTLMHPEGETATARAAGDLGVPLVVSTFAGRPFEEIAAAAQAPLWLQVYCFRDRETTRRLVERAERAGFEALVLTVDAPRLGRRLRDERNGFRLPRGITPANLPVGDYSSPAEHGRRGLDPGMDWSVPAWLRSVSRLPVLVKGVLTAEDAVRARAAGADGIVVSNHGGRQLDGAPATLDVLAEIAAAVGGHTPLLLDGGVRRGSDVLAALALGADAVLVGRPVLHGLAAGGRDGVAGVLRLFTDGLADAMALTGTATVADAGPALLRTPPVPPTGQRPAEQHVPPGGPARPGEARLRREELHRSVCDPVLDTMNFLNEVTERFPEAISFAPGRPYEGFFDTEQIFAHVRRYLDHLAGQGASPDAIRTALFQYGPTAGRIRELIAGSLRADEGIDVSPESVVVTVGGQEAMLLALRALFAGPDDVLLVVSPCYVGITGAARLLDIPVVPVEERADGLRCADVEAAIRAERAAGRRPRALYLVPDHSNPTGTTLSRAAREQLLDIAGRHDLLILEDSPYRLVSPGPQLPTLKSLDHARRVVHLGSYSKSVFPGARIGFVVADQPVVDAGGRQGLLADELARIKSMVTVNTPALSQAAVAGALLAAEGSLVSYNAGPAKHYGAALRALLDELDRQLPESWRTAHGVDWNRPDGGFFLTLRVPFRADDAALVRSAEEFGVLWTPMAHFHPGAGGDRAIRLSFSSLGPEEIEAGVARLARFVRAETARAAGPCAAEPAEVGL
ncbi:aminotransferase class I/II-fold pyridoxal phosphate-dependent enzyme [Streptomyces sp. TRM S81-3]|uniref:Aminotransferase class I/II-fold pyridoxal phosphate-dependent enzyme n=1 Tax=Streptomyces griseicoloratus TaxID=2752516 RepID=A0A926L297_9ACTN|nr:aminotransferase class I/II-fold pyridoxal phosphate-dependent enzyme [Streptomyces griseicoloratus]MBD0421123.1 aminotransferase class I/II-fold pyridoxal phosphate-dependent enzyme [Streptomyces griseicoloratus]